MIFIRFMFDFFFDVVMMRNYNRFQIVSHQKKTAITTEKLRKKSYFYIDITWNEQKFEKSMKTCLKHDVVNRFQIIIFTWFFLSALSYKKIIIRCFFERFNHVSTQKNYFSLYAAIRNNDEMKIRIYLRELMIKTQQFF